MSKEKKLTLLSAIFMIIYLVFNAFYLTNKDNLITPNKVESLFNIFVFVSSILGIILFIKYSYSKEDLDKHRIIILIFSILFFIYNLISGILGFIVIGKIGKNTKRELPKLEVEYNYKWYVYLIVFIIAMLIMFGLSNLFTNNIEMICSYIFIFLMVIYFFRKDLKRDFKSFKEYFREYNSYVFKMYGKSLIVMLILSISIKLTTGINNATNQETLNSLFKETPLLIAVLSVIYAPVAEELLFRGIFRKIINNKWMFILLSGIIFGAAHVIDDFQSIGELLYIFIYSSLGCFLAAVYYRTNNLFANMYFHFIQNFLSILALIIITFFPSII